VSGAPEVTIVPYPHALTSDSVLDHGTAATIAQPSSGPSSHQQAIASGSPFTRSAPWFRAIASSDAIKERNGFVGFGAHRVVGVGLRVSDGALAVDHKTRGHRELPRSISISLREVVLERV
jgi:hypothetical protein